MRRLAAAVLVVGGAAAFTAAVAAQGNTTVTVWKSPACGCCAEWVAHLQKAGFRVVVHDTADLAAVRRTQGVPDALRSCHTARAGRYAIEGHVPADLIQKLLREGPAAAGIAVPGMPAHAPGMDLPKRAPYDVLTFDAAGRTRVIATR